MHRFEINSGRPYGRGFRFPFRQLREHLRRYGVESAAKSMFERHTFEK